MEPAPSSFYGVNELELIDDLNKISLSSDTSPSDASVYKDHDSDSSQPRDSSPAIKIPSKLWSAQSTSNRDMVGRFSHSKARSNVPSIRSRALKKVWSSINKAYPSNNPSSSIQMIRD
ncbi:hypothetical protein I203_106806 [Kwoniella mangroviensis CBS 8507]|uniref:uncharacterized protein n=1 Tax=Kwoniella mangroviensis CBS 8507 TaxID=1296122 RepID=UPI00303B9C3A